MNTITNTASTNTILAVDLGKYKSVACVHDQATGEIRFTTFETTRAELRRLVDKEQPAVIIIEACLLAGWVHDLCHEFGVRCLVANTASEAWKFKHLKRKTDKDDALRLAQLYVLDQLPTVTLPPTTVRQWRSLIATRQNLVGRRIAVQNRIRALFVAQGLPAPRGAKAWSETGLAGIALQAKALGVCGPDELWRGLLELALNRRVSSQRSRSAWRTKVRQPSGRPDAVRNEWATRRIESLLTPELVRRGRTFWEATRQLAACAIRGASRGA